MKALQYLAMAGIVLLAITMLYWGTANKGDNPEPIVAKPALEVVVEQTPPFDPTDLNVWVRGLQERIEALESELDGTELPKDLVRNHEALKDSFLLHVSDDTGISKSSIRVAEVMEAWLSPEWDTDRKAAQERFLLLAGELGDQQLNNEVITLFVDGSGDPGFVWAQLIYLFMREYAGQ